MPARTGWALSHRVTESDTIRIAGGHIDHYSEGTYLSLGNDADGLDIPCYVTVFAPGEGGPEQQVGEKLPTKVRGRSGFRNGAGAEGPYLMWQQDGDSWTEVSCNDDRYLDAVAEAVVFRPSSIKLPFGLAPLPAGYGVSNLSSDLDQGSHSVYVGRIVPAFGHADPDVVISYAKGGLSDQNQIVRTITVNGRTAFLYEEPMSPGVCVLEQQRHICVSAYLSDTGPNPNRSGEIPALISIAEGLRFPSDFDDRSTWFESQNALPQ